MSQTGKTQALAAADEGTPAGALKELLGRFDMEMPLTAENLDRVSCDLVILDGIQRKVDEFTVVEKGKRFLWLKKTMQHGQWKAHLAANYPSLSYRSIAWWMAEAKYYLEHGRRKCAALPFSGNGPAGFTEEEADELDADDLADPSKPAPTPRKDLEKALLGLTKKVDTLIARDSKHQGRILELEASLRDARDEQDPFKADNDRKPVRTALIRALLAVGFAATKFGQATDEDLKAEDADHKGQLSGLVSQVQDRAVRLAEDCGWRVWPKVLPDAQANEFPEEIAQAERQQAAAKARRDKKATEAKAAAKK